MFLKEAHIRTGRMRERGTGGDEGEAGRGREGGRRGEGEKGRERVELTKEGSDEDLLLSLAFSKGKRETV